MAKKKTKIGGRPSSFSEELAAIICERLANGESMVQICQSPDMPDRSTVSRWQSQRPAFAAEVARAREDQADYMDHLILQTAHATNESNYNSNKVKMWAFQWRAAKLKPKEYSDKMQVGGIPGGEPIKVIINGMIDE